MTTTTNTSPRQRVITHQIQAARAYRAAVEAFMELLGITPENADQYKLVNRDGYRPDGLPEPNDGVVSRTVIVRLSDGEVVGSIEVRITGLYSLDVRCRREG